MCYWHTGCREYKRCPSPSSRVDQKTRTPSCEKIWGFTVGFCSTSEQNWYFSWKSRETDLRLANSPMVRALIWEKQVQVPALNLAEEGLELAFHTSQLSALCRPTLELRNLPENNLIETSMFPWKVLVLINQHFPMKCQKFLTGSTPQGRYERTSESPESWPFPAVSLSWESLYSDPTWQQSRWINGTGAYTCYLPTQSWLKTGKAYLSIKIWHICIVHLLGQIICLQ